ncbi:hypothetical protein SteCoe_36224 [Stentor coeruleus]|uniref:Uncharacterized protein n=1 Tax=Stentor coeruleus TaxID=5963 RepID=A0A1R2AQI6_9CILI|nr:hypothetical protein SteCoe_36224 [Stentor coeruleus]
MSSIISPKTPKEIFVSQAVDNFKQGKLIKQVTFQNNQVIATLVENSLNYADIEFGSYSSHVSSLYDYCQNKQIDLIMEYSFKPYHELKIFFFDRLACDYKIKMFQIFTNFAEPIAYNFVFKQINKIFQKNTKQATR